MSFALFRVASRGRRNYRFPPYFPVIRQYPENTSLLSRKGKLILKDNRIYFRPYLLGLIPFPLADGYLVIWPHGYSLVSDGQSIHIIDDIGKPVAKVGRGIRIHGQTALPEKAEAATQIPLPPDCRGISWIVHRVTGFTLD